MITTSRSSRLTRSLSSVQPSWETFAAQGAEALPAYVVATRLGHSPLVAAKHCLQTREAHFEAAIRGMPQAGEAEAQAAPNR